MRPNRLTPVTLAMILCASATGCAHADDIGDHRPEAEAAYIHVEGVGNDNRAHFWTGSGICVLRGGWVVTNRHVAPGESRTANTVRVVFNAGTPNEYSGPAEVVLVHADRDLALLKCRLDQEPPAVPMGETSNLSLTEPVLAVGFPLGSRVAVNNANPSITVVRGEVCSLRKDEAGRLWWVDVAAPVAGGNSGSGLLDEKGRLVGIVTQRYEGFARVIPVEYVRELLGEAALDVTFDPPVAEQTDGDVRIVVKPRGPANKLILGRAALGAGGRGKTLLMPGQHGGLTGTLNIPANRDREDRFTVQIRATAESGVTFERIVGLNRSTDAKTPLRGTIHSVTLKPLKPNGWRWDPDAPDPLIKLYVNGVLVKETGVRNQLRFLDATDFDCRSQDRIRIVVYDRDLLNHDYAGEITFTAEPDLVVTEATGQIAGCDITVRAIPLRPPAKQ